MTKQLLLYIEWTKGFGKKEFVCEVEATLSACTVKSVVWGGGRGGEKEQGRRRRRRRRM